MGCVRPHAGPAFFELIRRLPLLPPGSSDIGEDHPTTWVDRRGLWFRWREPSLGDGLIGFRTLEGDQSQVASLTLLRAQLPAISFLPSAFTESTDHEP